MLFFFSIKKQLQYTQRIEAFNYGIYYTGNPCGIMDQFVAVQAKCGHALMIDCRTLLYDAIPFNDPNLAVLVINSGVKHELAGGQYTLRREACEAAARTLNVRSLRAIHEGRIDYGNNNYIVLGHI